MSDDLLTIPPDASPLLRRAAIFISVGDFANADAYCERVLDETPENALAYLLKVMAKCKVQKAEGLVAVPELAELTEFKLARQFADAELSAKLDELLRERERIITAARPLCEACSRRIQALQELLAKPLPDALAAEVKARIEAENKFMAVPNAAAAEREIAATAELKDRIEKIPPILKACAARQGTLRKLLEHKGLPDDLAAEVRQRIEAEQNLMRAPDHDSAERETAATAELKGRVEKILPILKACSIRIQALQELLARPLPDALAAEVRQRIEAEQALMRVPTPEAAGREAAATAELKARIGSDMNMIEMLRAASALRQEVLRNLLQEGIPDDLADKIKARIEAEQTLMRNPTTESAEREADATSALKEKLVPYCRTQLAELLPKLEKIAQDQNVPKSDRKTASRRSDKIRALLEDQGTDLRTLGYESERCQVEFEGLSRYLNHSDIGLWVAVGFLILFAIIVFAFLV